MRRLTKENFEIGIDVLGSGYGSLLLSQNLGIRSFGLAAMIGELTCLAVALFLAPALLWTTAPALARRRSEVPTQ